MGSAEEEERDSELERKAERRAVVWSVLKSLSVEPAAFLLVVSLIVSHLLFQNVIMDTTCRVDLGYSEEACFQIINKV